MTNKQNFTPDDWTKILESVASAKEKATLNDIAKALFFPNSSNDFAPRTNINGRCMRDYCSASKSLPHDD